MTWVDELISAWARGDWGEISQSLGYPTTSPSFKGVGEAHEAPEPFEISAAEIRIVNEAMEWLAANHRNEFLALCRRHKPAQYGAPYPLDAYILEHARTRLSGEIKKRLEQSSL